MKILFLSRSLDRGGAERQLVALAKGLYDRGYTVKVLVFYGEGGFENELRDYGVSVINLHKKGRWDMLSFFIRMLKILKQEKPDILHSYLTVPNILSVIVKIMGLKASIVWGVRASDMDLSKYDWTARMTYRIECLLSCMADLVISNSNAGREYAISNGFAEEKIKVVSNGIDTERFQCNEAIRFNTRKEWNASDDTVVIGMVSRLDPMKGYEVFIQAAAILAKEYEKILFVSLGHGPEEYIGCLKKLALNLGLENRILWLGAHLDSSNVYCGYDIMTSASLFGEGFSNVIGEAMSCGVPCVVTDVGDAGLIVGEHGVVVQPGDVSGLVSAWKKLLDKSVLYENSQIRKRIVDHFSVHALIENSEKQLVKLVNKH